MSSIFLSFLPKKNIPLPFSNTLPPKTSTQTLQKLTPNKRPIEKEELWHNFVICAFALTTKELKAEIGIELTKELSSMCDKNPAYEILL
ncbi:14803_t:CDS:2 [Funneliformis mosseae]|uniref:14803_t:CDS:1 n=1 Tax=Funneliformis mosseae TaxID=27381 RepID=A0A9N9CBJ4_FUNMO|nr:14803_t:CDS:2 [Funneliformis mosseae]